VGDGVTESEKILGMVAGQLMNGEEVAVEGQRIAVKRVGRGRLRMVEFRMGGRGLCLVWERATRPFRF
jgi:hypothetical protein